MLGPLRIVIILSALLYGSFASAEKSAIPGQFPPKEIQKQVRPLLKQIRIAQADKNEKKILELSHKIITILGPWAGNPDNKPKYYLPMDRSLPDRVLVEQLWQRLDKKVRGNALWIENPKGNPDKMTHGLRQVARPVISYSQLYQIKGYQTAQNLSFIRDGADFLLKLQRKNGLFPSPDLRGDNEHYTFFNRRALRKNPDALVDGWFVDDYRGELQFDHALSGMAMINTYRITKEQKYLDSAARAADWAMQKSLDTNWAYNAYSVWLLAEYAQLSGQPKYLDSAIEKLKLGVLPGQLQNGRWFDPINSKLIYHSVNVRGMLAVYAQLKEESDFKFRLRESLVSAVNNAAQQINTHGASSATTSSGILVSAITLLGNNKLWDEALSININASLEALQVGPDAPAIGLFLPHYMYFVEKNRIQ